MACAFARPPAFDFLLFYFYLFSMADVHDPETRSYNMSRIRSKDTGPEMGFLVGD